MSDRKDPCGKWLTKALFIEFKHPKYTPSWTLKDEDFEKDGVMYPSLKQIFLAYSDPTEYSFATEVIGSWAHWQMICQSYHLKPWLDKWRDELEVKVRSEAVMAVRNSAINDGSKGVTAAKYMAEKGWDKKRGRPSKDEVTREKKIAAGISKEIEEDLARMEMH